MSALRDLYYLIKPVVPRGVRIGMRRLLARRILAKSLDVWPINFSAAKKPFGWDGWPGNKRFAFVLSHDVESEIGLGRVQNLMDMELSFGFRSSFNFIPEGSYNVSCGQRRMLEENGFEIGVHDLKHDGKLFKSRRHFERSARKINTYLKEWGAVGFRSGFMRHNLEWQHELNVLYDCSTFDSDVFEPQPDAVKTIFPFWCRDLTGYHGYVELPYTLAQDSTLFLILQEQDISIWKRKLDWIAQCGGMAMVNVHPDYMNFSGQVRDTRREYVADRYESLLRYVQKRYAGDFWQGLPKQVATYYRNWRNRNREQQIAARSREADFSERAKPSEISVNLAKILSFGLTAGMLEACVDFMSNALDLFMV